MVQLSPSLNLTPTPDLHNHVESPLDLTVDQLTADHMTSLKKGKDEGEGASEQMEVYPGYEGYIENGLICLKHKVRNLEKKKLKLEEYKLKLKRGHVLNKDQVASVEKYEEVLHHLSLAQELHQTLDSLSQNLLRAQKKAVKRQQMQSRELERRRLCSVLQFQQVLQSLNRDDVQSDLISGLNQAPQVPAQTLQCLRELRPLLGLTWDHALSVGEQMLRAAGLFMDLLDGKDAPVADSTFASLKEELRVLVHSPYFNSLPPQAEQSDKNYRDPNRDTSKFELPKSTRPEKPEPCSDPVWTWDSDCGALKGQEPPDHWDSRCTDQAPGESPTVGKCWRGGAALVLKNQPGVRRPEEGKRKERKARREEPLKPCVDLHMPVEVLTLPTDPELRRQRLEELLMNINGAFSFVQDSVLDGDCSPSSARHGLRRASGCPSPLAQSDLRSLGDPLPLQSTPLSGRRRDPKTSLTNGDHTLGSQDMELVSCCDTLLSYIEPSVSAVGHKPSAQSPAPMKPPLPRTPPMPQSFTTPPSRRALSPAHFSNMPTVFKVNPSLPPTDFSQTEHRPRIRSISTQTPPEFDTRDEESHEAGWSDMSLVSSIELGPRDSALDSGHGATSSASDLTSSGLVDAPLLPHAPPEAPPFAPLLPLCRVAFTALRTVNFAPGNLDQPIVFDQVHSNVGEMYDPRIGNFTCPVDGTYVFLFHILKLATYVPLYVNLMRNEEVMVSAYANDDAPDHETASNHAILPLFRGDQVWLRLHRGAIYGSTWKYSTFSGFLLYQD